MAASSELHRVYWNTQLPLACATDAINRYDCPGIVPKHNRFGVLCLAYEFETCWLETVVRNALVRPAGDPIRMPAAKMTNRWACEVHVAVTLTIAKSADESLVDLGESASNIMGEGYLRTQTWSNLLHTHANDPATSLEMQSTIKRFNVVPY